MALVTWAFVGLVLLLAVALVVVRLTEGDRPAPEGPPLAPGSVVSALSGLPQSAFDAAGVSGLGALPQVVSGQGPYQVSGRPAVVFVGAEFSPYSAAASWALVTALARFGTWTDLGLATSPSTVVFGRATGFSFTGAGYRSPYIVLQAVESYSSQLASTAPGGFVSLASPSAGVLSQLRRFDGQDGTTLLPFVDVAGRVVITGSAVGFSPGLLQGQSMSQVASALGNPTSPLGQAVLGAANVIEAAVCAVDGGRPAPVCSTAGTRAAAARLGLP